MKTLPRLSLITALAIVPIATSTAKEGSVVGLNEEPTVAVRKIEPSKVDFKGFQLITKKVSDYRAGRLINLDKFNAMSGNRNTIILDTRSAKAFKGLHVKGAIHLNFSDFTATKLAKVIPNKNTCILIYCNNNFKDNKRHFEGKSIELALNIPTFINLYGYGYTNIYELSELLSVKDKRLKLDGTDVPR